jgi:hypothetical protein
VPVITSDAIGESGSARAELMQLTQLFLPFAIRGLATLGVADALASGPATVETIAEAVNAEAGALYRTLHFTASRGVFTELPGKTFALNPVADLMRSDAPGSMRSRLMIDDGTANALRVLTEVTHTLRTGESAYRKVMGISPFEAIATGQRSGGRVIRRRNSAGPVDGLLSKVDFGNDRIVADVGGGTGTMIGGILARYPDLQGVLFDLPSVVEHAAPELESLAVKQRCQVVGGDMFREVPADADTYVLSNVLHDWPDEQAKVVLTNIRKAIPDNGRLLVLESLVGDEPERVAQIAQQDFMLLLNTGGRERTAGEHEALLQEADFRVTSVTPLSSEWGTVIEARPSLGSLR